MSLSYKAVARKNPRKLEDPPKFYAVPVYNKKAINMPQIAQEIAERMSLNRTDVMAVLDGLTQVIPFFIGNAFIVHLGEFGNFRVTFSSEGVATEEEVNPTIIKDRRLRFHPGKDLTRKIEDIDISNTIS